MTHFFCLDRSNEQQHILDFDNIRANESADVDDDNDYDEEGLDIEEIIYGIVGEQAIVA